MRIEMFWALYFDETIRLKISSMHRFNDFAGNFWVFCYNTNKNGIETSERVEDIHEAWQKWMGKWEKYRGHRSFILYII